jgi:hypothetical protein
MSVKSPFFARKLGRFNKTGVKESEIWRNNLIHGPCSKKRLVFWRFRNLAVCSRTAWSEFLRASPGIKCRKLFTYCILLTITWNHSFPLQYRNLYTYHLGPYVFPSFLEVECTAGIRSCNKTQLLRKLPTHVCTMLNTKFPTGYLAAHATCKLEVSQSLVETFIDQ